MEDGGAQGGSVLSPLCALFKQEGVTGIFR